MRNGRGSIAVRPIGHLTISLPVGASDFSESRSPPFGPMLYSIDFTILSTIFFASAKSIMVLSRKNSSFSTPA